MIVTGGTGVCHYDASEAKFGIMNGAIYTALLANASQLVCTALVMLV